MKVATLFSGFDGAGEGIRAAGFQIAWGIELDDKIASVARMNGHNVITADVTQVDPAQMEPVDALHISPSCTRASVANSSAEENEDGLKESQLDIDLANASIRFIETLQPKIVTIENVWGYRKFQSYRGGKKCEGILPALERLGYWIDAQHVNSADFGVPQTRKRLILRAIKGGWVPHLPEPEPWVGWYAAIEDLIPGLPESEFAPWQLERLPEELKTFLLCNGERSEIIPAFEPIDTITANRNQRSLRAFLVNTNQSGDEGEAVQCNKRDEPAFTVTQSANGRLRAFLVNTREMHGNDGAPYTAVDRLEPCNTVPASSGASRHKAFLINGDNASRDLTVCAEQDPFWTVQSSIWKAPARAWLRGRVVKMTSRCLARFQSFRDSYILPENNALACKGIGNAVPPLMFEKIYKQLREAVE